MKTDFFGYDCYTITDGALSVSILTLGATVVSLRYRGKELALHYDDAAGYLGGTSYAGAIVGRVANRIADSRAALNGREYSLTPNEGKNQLHGGPNAFDRKIWTAEELGENAVRFSCTSPDGENGYPGNLTAAVTYRIEGERLRIDFEGACDADTFFAPTTHLYFTLTENALDTVLQISADSYLPVDASLLPVGAPAPVDEVFDFRAPRKIGQDYDHCFVLSQQTACVAEGDGVRMTLRTDFPGLQLYTGQALAAPLKPYQGFAIEPEFFPDAPHHPDYPSVVLKGGEVFRKFVEYTFETVE